MVEHLQDRGETIFAFDTCIPDATPLPGLKLCLVPIRKPSCRVGAGLTPARNQQ
jgi:hypothetical protein